jgi:hypothetical protein
MSTLTVLQGCRTLQLTKGFNTLIDEEDFERVGRLKWIVQPSLHVFYARRTERVGVNRRRLAILHRVLLDAPKGMDVDHRNGDGLDNRKANLRLATHSQNHQNRRMRPKGRSRFKCVSLQGNTWRAYISVAGRLKDLGRFTSEEDAARAYDVAAREHFGEFACTNADIYGDY